MTTASLSLTEILQDLVAERLAEVLHSEPGLQALQIITEHQGDLDDAIRKRIARASIGLTISTPSWKAGDDPRSLEVDLGVALAMNAKANAGELGTRRTANEIGELLYASLHNWQPEDESWTPLQFQSFALRDADENAEVLFYVALFKTSTFPTVTEAS